MTLSNKEWNNYLLPDIFKQIQRGKRYKKADQVMGTIPYVSSTANNNGVDGYVEASERTRVFENCISLANSGSVGKAFYEPFKFVASDHVTSLKNVKLNNYQYLFLTSAIEKQKSNFNFNREINDDRIKTLQIMLPVSENNEPDYEYMSEYIQEYHDAMLAKYRGYVEMRIAELGNSVDIPTLDEKKWMPFSIVELFSSIIPGKGKGLNHLNKVSNGGINYIGATNRNNGVLCYIEDNENSRSKVLDGNCIGFIKNGDGSAGFAIYKSERFISTSDILYGYADWLNKFTGLFFVAAQDMIERKYSHGYKRNKDHLAGDKVMLPINDKDDPDFEYMEQYAKNMILYKYKQYLAFLENK